MAYYEDNKELWAGFIYDEDKIIKNPEFPKFCS